MKNLTDVLKQKEAELQNVQREIDALRVAIRLCNDGTDEMPSRDVAPGDSASKPVRGVAMASDRVIKQFP